MSVRSDVAIVIPAFNEANTIVDVVNAVLPYGLPIVVDDCSHDGTGELAKNFGAIVIRHQTNTGYDGALNTGFAEAKRNGCAYVVTFDADGQHTTALLKNFILHLENGYDLVLGIRDQNARFSEYLFSYYMKLRFGVKDPLCGMKGYRMSLFDERGWFDSYQSIGTELLMYGLLKKKKFIQVPVPILMRRDHSRFGLFFKTNYSILRSMMLSWFKV